MSFKDGCKTLFNLRTLIVLILFVGFVYYYYSHRDWTQEVRITEGKRIDLMACIHQVPGLAFHVDARSNDDTPDLFITAVPGDEFRYQNISIHDGAFLHVKYGFIESASPDPSSQVTFEVEAVGEEGSELLLSDSMTPAGTGLIEQYRYKKCPLDTHASGKIDLVFRCLSEPSDDLICGWGDLKIDSSGRKRMLKRIYFLRYHPVQELAAASSRVTLPDAEAVKLRFSSPLPVRPRVTVNGEAVPADLRGADLGSYAGEDVKITIDPQADHVQIMAGEPTRRRFSSKKEAPNLVIVNIDGLSASLLGCYGSPLALTPSLDRMAESGIMFKDFFAASPETPLSTATLLTGLYPSEHGMGSGVLEERLVTLPERLQEEGVTTAAFLAAQGCGPETNLDQGFETFVHLPQQNARKLNALFSDWLISNENFRFFAYLHYGDTAPPFNAPGGLKNRHVPERLRSWSDRYDQVAGRPVGEEEKAFLHGRYQGEVEYLDRRIEDILRHLLDFNLLDKTLIMVTASRGHGTLFADASIRVPLILIGPEEIVGPHRVVEAAADHASLMDTALALMGVVTEDSLYPFEQLLEDENRYARSEAGPLKAVMNWRYKLIQGPGTRRLFDLVADPMEEENLAGTGLEAENLLLGALDAR